MLDVKPATQVLARRTVEALAKGESLTLSDMFADLVAGTGSVSVSVGPSTALDAAAILKALDRYPFGCSEQITSRAIPLLYVNELATGAQLAMDTEVDQRIRDAIDRLLARQGSDGSFGLWSAGGDDVWLDAYVTDFLTRARERGFAVPDIAFRRPSITCAIQSSVAPEPEKDGGRDLAYALYVLARNAAAPIGDLRYIADTKLSNLATPIAKAQIAAALGLLGDRARAERVYAAALEALAPQPRSIRPRRLRLALRDGAALVTLASESNAPRPIVTGACTDRNRACGLRPIPRRRRMPGWCWPHAPSQRKRISLNVNGEAVKTVLYQSANAAEMASKPLKITNNGNEPLQAVVSVTGAPIVPEPAIERLQDRAALLHARRRGGGYHQGRSRTSASRWC